MFRKKFKTPVIGIALVLLAVANCATFAKLGSQDLLVIGPEDSHIFLNDEKIGESVAMKKIGFPSKEPNQKKIVRIEKNGFEPNITELEKETNPWFWGNFLFLGGAPIGFLVDYLSDTNSRFTPRAFKAEMKENPNFKVDLSKKEIQNYQLAKEKTKDLEILLTFSNLSELSMVKVDEKGNPLPGTEQSFTNFLGNSKTQITVSPGNYLLKARYRTSQIVGNTITTYTAKKSMESVVKIPGGGVGSFCGIIDPLKKATSVRFIHLTEPNAKALEGLIPGNELSLRISNSCDDVFGIPDLLSLDKKSE